MGCGEETRIAALCRGSIGFPAEGLSEHRNCGEIKAH